MFYEVEILRVPHPDGGDLWVYVNAEGERLKLGQLKPGNRFVSTLDGLALFEMGNGFTVVEDIMRACIRSLKPPPTTRNTHAY